MKDNAKDHSELDRFLNQYQKQNYFHLKEPLHQYAKKLERTLEAFSKTREDLHKLMDPLHRSRDLATRIAAASGSHPSIMSDLKPFLEQVEKVNKSVQALISPAFKEIQRSFDELPLKTQEALILLGSHGWYLDLEMPTSALWPLKKALAEGSFEDVETVLEHYFEKRLDDIEASLVEGYPAREKIIRSAFKAHKRCEYELSVPALLSQSDGICKEVVNQYFFIKQNKKPCTAIYVEQFAAAPFRAALLSPLACSLPISFSEKDRRAGSSELNRHMVLHGESLDYGTKVNSLKSISLINYVAHVLKLDDDRI